MDYKEIHFIRLLWYGLNKNTYNFRKKHKVSEVATSEFLIWETYILFISKSTKQQKTSETIT